MKALQFVEIVYETKERKKLKIQAKGISLSRDLIYKSH